MMPLTAGAQIDELRRLFTRVGAAPPGRRTQARRSRTPTRHRTPNNCYPRSPYRQNDCRTRAAAGCGDSDRAQRLRARLPALIQEHLRALTPPLAALEPEPRVLLMIRSTRGHYAEPSAGLRVDRAEISRCASVRSAVHRRPTAIRNPESCRRRPCATNYSPTTANAEEPIRIVGFAADRIPIAYQTDRKTFPFRSGLWLPGDYGSTPRSRRCAHDYVLRRDDEPSPWPDPRHGPGRRHAARAEAPPVP